jgi:hypothetical protein
MINTKVAIIADNELPLKSPNTHLVAASACAGGELAENGYLDTIEQAQDGSPRRSVVWCMDEKEIVFNGFIGETIMQSEFIRRWTSKTWCDENPDHPIAFMKFYQETLSRLRDHLKKQTPTLMIKKGGRTAFIPANASETERNKIISKL